ncbi:MAG: 23S rRNA (guanosine(2251)-2'-O)-methyltransferase RlmB [Vicinamibacterales bacterium]
MIVFGIHAVREALRADRVERLVVGRREDGRLQAIVDEAARRQVSVERAEDVELDRRSRGGVHQGVMAFVRPPRVWQPSDLVSSASGPALIVVLDGIEDPGNVGAILRSCDAAGVDGVIRQTRRAAPLEGAAAKASAGASLHVRVADVVNIARALDELKGLGVWVVGLAGDGAQDYDRVDLTMPTAFVLGAEGKGLRRLVRESCDWVVRIPLCGRVDSLNVSVAAGVALFEAQRQRRLAYENR